MAPTRTSRYARRARPVNTKRCDCQMMRPNDATSFLGHHISATFELRAGVVKAEARRVERSESLDDVEHGSTLIM